MNLARFAQVLDYITEHTEEWDQAEWCGTSHCLAGHAAVMSGRLRPDVVLTPVDAPGGFRVARQVAEIGQEWLELDDDEDDYLFDAARTLDDFKSVLAAGKVPA